MATQQTKTENPLRLDRITLQNVLNREYTFRLSLENEECALQTTNSQTWTPVHRLDIYPTSKMRAEIQMRSGHLFWAKTRQTSEVIDLQALFDEYWSSIKHEFTVPKVVFIGKYRWFLELRFSADNTADSLRLLLHDLEGLLKECSPLMSEPTERPVGKGIKFGAVFAELNPIAKAIFDVARVTFELLKEKNKYDQVPSGLLDQLQRILSLANKVADEIICEKTKLLENIIPRVGATVTPVYSPEQLSPMT